MKWSGKRSETEDESFFEVTSMVDVVFILLAFFVLTVRFAGGEQDLPVGATEVGDVAGASTQDLPSEVLVRVRPGRGGELWLAVGQNVLDGGGLDRLTATLTQMNTPELPVVLAADGGLSVQDIAAVMDAVMASPMKRLSLARLDADNPEASEVSTETGGGS